jgi:hypothetical protein
MNAEHETREETLAALIAEGLSQRGFHFSNEDELKALWTGEEVGEAGRFRRLQEFARAHQWKFVSRDNCRNVLFQPLDGHLSATTAVPLRKRLSSLFSLRQ